MYLDSPYSAKSFKCDGSVHSEWTLCYFGGVISDINKNRDILSFVLNNATIPIIDLTEGPINPLIAVTFFKPSWRSFCFKLLDYPANTIFYELPHEMKFAENIIASYCAGPLEALLINVSKIMITGNIPKLDLPFYVTDNSTIFRSGCEKWRKFEDEEIFK